MYSILGGRKVKCLSLDSEPPYSLNNSTVSVWNLGYVRESENKKVGKGRKRRKKKYNNIFLK